MSQWTDLLETINNRRHSEETHGWAQDPLEREVEREAKASTKLFVYGTLAPGQVNEHILAPLDGTWRTGSVRGRLHAEGWGARWGAPAIELDSAGSPVPGWVFCSEDLPGHWTELDRFEGSEYRRLLVAVERSDGGREIANIYTLTPQHRRPVDVATEETLRFVRRATPEPGHLLEVGCGQGDLACALQEVSYQVAAIDAEVQAASRARQRGVATVAAKWPRGLRAAADVLLFSRCLHHFHDLDAAVRAVPEALLPAGWLLVEEFDSKAMTAAGIDWFLATLRAARSDAGLSVDRDPWLGELVRASDPLDFWRASHAHVHGSEEMHRALRAVASPLDVEATPYLYRYLIPALPETNSAAGWLRRVATEEARRARLDEIPFIGCRFVGRLNRPLAQGSGR